MSGPAETRAARRVSPPARQPHMTALLRMPRWSPYAVGAGIGVLSWITFALMGKPLGTSTTMVHAVGGIERIVAPDHFDRTEYLTKYIGTTADPKPIFEWQFALVVMLAIGALLAARLAGQRERETVPALWRARFGDSVALRYGAAFVGGAILLFGARLAGGCTSGHGISGGLQLAVSSWVFIAAMLGSGIATAFLIYGKEGRRHAR
ncbi:MAG: YeeE/YedE thiosulfate transporter family protein [Planctomycetota bacterium]